MTISVHGQLWSHDNTALETYFVENNLTNLENERLLEQRIWLSSPDRRLAVRQFLPRAAHQVQFDVRIGGSGQCEVSKTKRTFSYSPPVISQKLLHRIVIVL